MNTLNPKIENFLDADILVSVLDKEYPLFTYTARILSLTDHKRFSVHTSPICLAIAFYSPKKSAALKWQKGKSKYYPANYPKLPGTNNG